MNAQDVTSNAGNTGDDQEGMTRIIELMGQKIEMYVDLTLFTPMAPNFYVSENSKGVIMAMMVPDSYENSKIKMDKDIDEQFTVTEKGETEINGVKTLFMKGTSEAEGSVLDNMIYCVKVDDNTCLMIVGMIDQLTDAKYIESIMKTVNSLIKKKLLYSNRPKELIIIIIIIIIIINRAYARFFL
jgi:hypothetical protein